MLKYKSMDTSVKGKPSLFLSLLIYSFNGVTQLLKKGAIHLFMLAQPSEGRDNR